MEVSGHRGELHIATEPQTGLVTAVALTPANTPDADVGANLVAGEPPGTYIIADSAYASGSALKTFNNNRHTPIVKPIVRKPHIRYGYHRDDFGIDTGARTVTCPAGHTTRIRPGGTAPFAKWRNRCPLRTRCTTSERVRTIQSRPTPRPTRREQNTMGQRRNAAHLPDLPATSRTGHRLAHPPPTPDAYPTEG